MIFENWGAGQPDDFRAIEHFAHLNGGVNSKGVTWSNLHCCGASIIEIRYQPGNNFLEVVFAILKEIDDAARTGTADFGRGDDVRPRRRG